VESSASQQDVSKNDTAFHIADSWHLLQPVGLTSSRFRYRVFDRSFKIAR
jgi:hypothetical protein